MGSCLLSAGHHFLQSSKHYTKVKMVAIYAKLFAITTNKWLLLQCHVLTVTWHYTSAMYVCFIKPSRLIYVLFWKNYTVQPSLYWEISFISMRSHVVMDTFMFCSVTSQLARLFALWKLSRCTYGVQLQKAWSLCSLPQLRLQLLKYADVWTEVWVYVLCMHPESAGKYSTLLLSELC